MRFKRLFSAMLAAVIAVSSLDVASSAQTPQTVEDSGHDHYHSDADCLDTEA